MNSKINVVVAIVQALLLLPLLAQAQDQDKSGSINIDCGISGVSKYTDKTMNITYVSDAGFIETGENRDVNKTVDDAQLMNLRSFPHGIRNCYTLKLTQGKGNKYLIRARFFYGNYDNELKAPTFDLYLGANFWATVMTWNSQSLSIHEMIYVPSSDYINVCLVNTGNGIPFISALELKPITAEVYLTEPGKSLQLYNRLDFSSSSKWIMRYKNDIYDRSWTPIEGDVSITSTMSDESRSYDKGLYEVPFTVMNTAATNKRSENFVNLNLIDANTTSEYIFYMHFAEVEELESNQTREFEIYMNDDDYWYGPVKPSYMRTNTIMSGSEGVRVKTGKKDLKVWFNNTDKATLPPLINAMEIFVLRELSLQDTDHKDVEAMLSIKSVYQLKRIEWQGDPCTPQGLTWSGLNCSYPENGPPRITSLNLSSSSLNGEITAPIANMTMLEYLDLSNNQLAGTVPESLSQLPQLKILNLKGNNFTGPIPKALLSKKDLQLSLDAYLIDSTQCSSGSCGKKNNFVVPIAAALGGILLIAMIIVAVILSFKRRRQQNVTNVRVEASRMESRSVDVNYPREGDEAFGIKKHQFTYSDIQIITNNFNRVLGQGGFGTVYHGYLDGNEVAVKMLSSPSIQGHRQFHTELILLLRVHHKNLTTLVGYCNEGTNIALIYEYMAMGNLHSHIIGGRQRILSWEDRLRIAIDTSQGLEYLHNGCKPPIIHRDVKSTNILLNEKFQAKLGDFGISKVFPAEEENQVNGYDAHGIAASIAGTPGYLDPEYYNTNWLNEKSDVYSFGIVLLEIITARPVFTKTGRGNKNDHIIDWASSMLAVGDITNILDPRLENRVYDINTVWKAIEIAMACVSKTAANRPTMSQVITELKECLMTELTEKQTHNVADLPNDSSIEIMSRVMVSEFSPIAR